VVENSRQAQCTIYRSSGRAGPFATISNIMHFDEYSQCFLIRLSETLESPFTSSTPCAGMALFYEVEMGAQNEPYTLLVERTKQVGQDEPGENISTMMLVRSLARYWHSKSTVCHCIRQPGQKMDND
jgi:hypothetical protein